MKNIAAALIKAKSLFDPVLKNKSNPHFKSKYADLAAILDAIETGLTTNGILLYQPIEQAESGQVLKTILLHAESGETIESAIALPSNSDPQKFGSALTYYRRFSLCSLLAIAAEDDDGNLAAAKPVTPRTEPVQTTYKVNPIAEKRVAIGDCFEELGWDKKQRQDWAQTISKLASDKWDLKTWNAALVDLQSHLDSFDPHDADYPPEIANQ